MERSYNVVVTQEDENLKNIRVSKFHIDTSSSNSVIPVSKEEHTISNLIQFKQVPIHLSSNYNLHPDVKPPVAYSRLIAKAILTSPNRRLTLHGIYTYLKENYAYFRYSDDRWQVG